MNTKVRIADLPEFDLSEYLGSEEDIAAYLTMVIEGGDAGELAHALGQVARASGLSREALYKALRPGAHPRFDTINRACSALGVRLVAQPLHV